MAVSDITAALAAYIDHHPRAWENLRATIEHAVGAPGDTLPMVRVRITTT
jgi:hypothetical protein